MKRVLSFVLLAAGLLHAQVPDTDLWLFNLKADKTKQLFPYKALNITNRPGYDNQPFITPNGKKIFYVSIGPDKQADIYSYTISSKKREPVTSSRESEYSPMLMQNGNLITVVMVEADSTQRIHFINSRTGKDEGCLAFDSVGYYTALNTDTMVYYKLTAPHSLGFYAKKQNETQLCNSPARGFAAINRYTLIYGIKDSAKVSFFKYDFRLNKAVKYCEYPSLNEDIVWHQTWGLIKSEGTRLYRYVEEKNAWELLYDLGQFGIKKITRFAFDAANKYLVVVNNV